MKTIALQLIFFLSFVTTSAQSQATLVSYNLLNYPGTDTTTRNPYLRTTLSTIQPDILVVQEITSQAGVYGILNNVLHAFNNDYSSGTFINGTDTDNAIFFRSSKFQFIANNPIQTALRDINEFIMVHSLSQDTLRIYSVHLKSSTGTANENQRAAEIDSLRKRTNSLYSGSYFILLGDFNIYDSGEPAYLKIIDQSQPGYFIDINPLTGTWNNSAYAQYHTQSTRTRSFGGGATGGLDDRFDMILFSQSIIDSGRVTYVPGSYTAFGNDGQHFNDSINRPPNNAVSQEIANALHYTSDHLPVIANLLFDNVVPVDIYLLTTTVFVNNIILRWTTISETNLLGFQIERRTDRIGNWQEINFIESKGNSITYQFYEYYDNDLLSGSYEYRIKYINTDGTFEYSPTIEADIYAPKEFVLYQNYPNPFNPTTTISYDLPHDDFVTLKVYDILGNEITTLVNQFQRAGSHKIIFDASTLSSSIYFYILKSHQHILIQKMLYLK